MLAAYAREGRQIERIEAALEGRWPLTGALSWSDFERRVEGAACAVVALPRITGRSAPEGLLAFDVRFPSTPLVLVTRRRAANLRALTGVEVEEVVWQRDLDHALAPAVAAALSTTALGRARRRVARAPHLPPVVKEALGLALKHEPPLPSVQEWARALDRDRRTLWYHGRKLSGRPGSGEAAATKGGDEDVPGPKQLLSWIQLVRAVAARRPGQSWQAVARRLRIDLRTLRRRAKELAGRPLAELEFAAEEVRDAFEARLERLLEAPKAESDTLT